MRCVSLDETVTAQYYDDMLEEWIIKSTSVEDVLSICDNYTEIDAVPVSFIRELINLARKVGADDHAESLEILLADWADWAERKEE